MKYRLFFFSSIVFFFVCANNSFAQGSAKTSEWRGLILGVSNVLDAVERLGDPATDRLGQRFRPLILEELFDVETKNFRVLHYEDRSEIEGFNDVKLYFRKDVLLAIRLEPKKLKAFALERAYDDEFRYVEDEVAEILIPREVGRRRGRPYQKRYPMFYYLMNQTSEAYAFAAIDNNSVEEIFGDRRNSQATIPGKVSKLDLISTELESKGGADLLK